jgi:hypothetical protein
MIRSLDCISIPCVSWVYLPIIKLGRKDKCQEHVDRCTSHSGFRKYEQMKFGLGEVLGDAHHKRVSVRAKETQYDQNLTPANLRLIFGLFHI